MKRAALPLLVLVTVLALAISSSAKGEPVKLGLGHVTSIAKSQGLTVDASGKAVPPMAQADSVIAAVAFDKDGRIVHVNLDTAQTKINFNRDWTISTDITVPGQTKKELGDAYGMRRASSIGKEWFEQIAEFEKWMVGKTVDEVKALKVKERDAAHPAVPDVPELTSSVTITVQDYIAAVEKAWENAVPVKAGGKSLGFGHDISLASSKPGAPQVDTTLAATLFDDEGKVVGVVLDVIQSKIPYDTKTSQLAVDPKAPILSKKELKDNYGMRRASAIGKEWYEQAVELEKWMIGKTAAEIQNLKVKQRDASHVAVPDVPELTSLVTITVEKYLAALGEAYNGAN
ncbi:MAG: hypothetical protein GX047_03205 [Firmicutes bacterium]|nr:hypothetical protein [Bacillota bacterium]